MFLDLVLSWMVIVVPVVFGVILIFVPARKEDEKTHMRWRYILGVALIIFGALSWWQQSRATAASSKDREDAIAKTSEKVAAETSKQVTQTVSELYS